MLNKDEISQLGEETQLTFQIIIVYMDVAHVNITNVCWVVPLVIATLT